MTYKVAFETFGCRLNQAETAIFARQFAGHGYELVLGVDDADLCVINTCTLTSQATSKCRRFIRSILRRNPDLCVAAVGCYAQTGAEELRAIPGLDYIVGTSEKMRLLEIIPEPAKIPVPVVVLGRAARESFTIEGSGYYPVHTRANLKVQEGCNFVCSFCIIPKSRGPARSRDFDDVIREARVLAAEGHREFVITGVNVGTYVDGGRKLTDLVDAVAAVDGVERIRMSSIEPTTIDGGLIERMGEGAVFCPYLHIPLQSGNDGVLGRMRRKYTVREYVDFIEDVIERVPHIGLGTDAIVGFPGETTAAFEDTCRIVEAVPFNNVHVFSFSAREGTGAYRMADPVPGNVIADRSRVLHDIAERKKREFYDAQIGRTLRVLFEGHETHGLWVGFSDNYVKVGVRASDDLANRLCDVRIVDVVAPDDARGLRALGELTVVESQAPVILAHVLKEGA